MSTRAQQSAAAVRLTALFERAAAGDERAFAQVYDATAARVYGLALRVLRNPAQAEEASQEAFVDVWRTASRFDASRGSAISWILMITHRAAVSRVRSSQAGSAREVVYERERLTLEHSSMDTTHDLVQASLEATRVGSALGKLTTLQREALELAYFGGYTHSEVAERVGVPLGTAKSRIRDGLVRLRDVIGER